MLCEKQGMHPSIMERPSSGLHSVPTDQEFFKMYITVSFTQGPFCHAGKAIVSFCGTPFQQPGRNLSVDVQLVTIVLSDEQFTETDIMHPQHQN